MGLWLYINDVINISLVSSDLVLLMHGFEFCSLPRQMLDSSRWHHCMHGYQYGWLGDFGLRNERTTVCAFVREQWFNLRPHHWRHQFEIKCASFSQKDTRGIFEVVWTNADEEKYQLSVMSMVSSLTMMNIDNQCHSIRQKVVISCIAHVHRTKSWFSKTKSTHHE